VQGDTSGWCGWGKGFGVKDRYQRDLYRENTMPFRENSYSSSILEADGGEKGGCGFIVAEIEICLLSSLVFVMTMTGAAQRCWYSLVIANILKSITIPSRIKLLLEEAMNDLTLKKLVQL